jgi:hypothetical protein
VEVKRFEGREIHTLIWLNVYSRYATMTSAIARFSTTPEEEHNSTVFDLWFVRTTVLVVVLAFVATALAWLVWLAYWRWCQARDEHQEIPLVLIRETGNGVVRLDRETAGRRAVSSRTL